MKLIVDTLAVERRLLPSEYLLQAIVVIGRVVKDDLCLC